MTYGSRCQAPLDGSEGYRIFPGKRATARGPVGHGCGRFPEPRAMRATGIICRVSCASALSGIRVDASSQRTQAAGSSPRGRASRSLGGTLLFEFRLVSGCRSLNHQVCKAVERTDLPAVCPAGRQGPPAAAAGQIHCRRRLVRH